ncbi:hypothetical protein AB0F46_40710 [Streptomyces sp. NPDC026665]|uniref:hypothetical protein n=1 Tax=Streptomyces sp. NPDC026665 TaxID=3154798 RepID=UPI0033FA1F70
MALSVGLAAAFMLTACGVPPSDVIQAGEPAGVEVSPSPKPSAPVIVSFYFLHDGELTAYLRRIDGPSDLTTVIGLLFDGPTRVEALKASTELPRLTTAPEVTGSINSAVFIQLPDGIARLSHPAMLQLACTVAHVRGSSTALPADPYQDDTPAESPASNPRSPARTGVHVLGDGWDMTQSAGSCPSPSRP